jgi:capsular polysaccharide transport system ATP-binding protein
MSMIEFKDVHKSFKAGRGYKTILESSSFRIGVRQRIGVIGPNGCGKTTLMRILAGNEPINAGEINRVGRISFPVGFRGTFSQELSGAENVRFLARIYGMDVDETVAWVEDFCEIGDYFYLPVRTYSAGMFGKVAFATSFAIDFDFYLVDEVVETGDRRFRDKCAAALNARLENSSLILISQNMRTIKAFCQSGAVLYNGQLVFYDNLDDAIEHYEKITR